MASILVGASVVIAVTYAFLWALLHLTQDENEPPTALASMPFVGPVVEMARQKSRFHSRLRDKLGLPIYTLRLPGTRMYVVNSTSLIPAVQRLYRTISFTAIEAQAAANIFSLAKPALKIVKHGLMEDDSYTGTFASAIHPALTPGANLDAMNRQAAQAIACSLEKLQSDGGTITTLFEWVRDGIVLATSDAVYGPHNPFRDPEVLKAWHQFEPKVMTFALGLAPRIFAREAFLARRRIVAAFAKYFADGHHEQGSALVKCRYQHSTSFGFSIEDIARAEIGGAFAVLGSTSPACFWMIYHLYSDSTALEACRKEAMVLVKATSEEQGTVGELNGKQQKSSSIDVVSVKTKCPLLLSTLQEVLRFRHIGVSARVVLQDEQLLGGKYHLKKDSVVMIPTPVFHSDPTVWGPTGSTFDHGRFLPDDLRKVGIYNGQKPTRKTGLNTSASRGSYRPFGGGHVLCPGRHFATTEILAFAALVILRFDITPTAGNEWKAATIEQSPMVAALPVPDDPIAVEIRPREPDRKWHVELVESDRAAVVAVEDIEA